MADEYKIVRDSVVRKAEISEKNMKESQVVVRQVRTSVTELQQRMQEQGDQLRRTRLFVNSLPGDPTSSEKNAVMQSLFLLDAELGRTVQDTERQRRYLEVGSERLATAVSTTAVAYGATGVTDSVIMNVGEAFTPQRREVTRALSDYSQPSLIEKRRQLGEMLAALSPLLQSKFEEAFQTFDTGGYMSAAHAMREVLSQLGHLLGPNDQIEKASWYKPEKGEKKPTQRQRIKYAIIGAELDSRVDEADLERVDQLATQARDSYQKLSGEAHRRSQTWERDRVREYLGTAEAVMRQVLDLRELLSKK